MTKALQNGQTFEKIQGARGNVKMGSSPLHVTPALGARTSPRGALFPPTFARGVRATPPLCANGECGRRAKGTPPSLGPARLNRTASAGPAAAALLALPAVRTGWGESAPTAFGHGPGIRDEGIHIPKKEGPYGVTPPKNVLKLTHPALPTSPMKQNLIVKKT